ncbi:MAG: hypothetical protein SOZ72_03625 [Treponema sp.]|nr:hypothetical protein [Treponema sp.]
MKENTKPIYNIFLFSCVICFVQFCFIFVAIIRTGYYFADKVLFASFFSFVIWLFLFLFQDIKNKSVLRFDILKISSILFAFVLGFFFVKLEWFYGYLNLDPVLYLMKGRSHIDTLFHSAIAESYITNGFPSINFNEPILLKYHTFSHFLIAVLSKILDIPAFIFYNYLFPIFSIPLYVFLVQYSLFEIKKMLKVEQNFSFWDSVFLFLFLGFFLIHSLYISESCLVSVIFMLLGLNLILKSKNIFIARISLSSIILVPVFIFLVSWGKISCGMIFTGFFCYYLFRENIKSINNWGLIILYAVTFVFSYKCFSNTSGTDSSKITLFHFARNYLTLKTSVFYYFSQLIPALLCLIFVVKEKFLSKEYFKNRENILPETMLVASIVSFLPGIFLTIGGGSAAYFCIPAFVLNLLILWGCDIPNRLVYSLSKIGRKFLFASIFSICIWSVICVSDPFHNIITTLKINTDFSDNQQTTYTEKLKECFKPALGKKIPLYKSVEKIRDISKNNRKDLCVFIDDDCYFYDIYGHDKNPPHYGLKECFALTSYIGLPVINALYTDGEYSYRGDGENIGQNGVNEYYGIGSVKKHSQKITKDNMREFARSIGKSNIIVVTKDSFYIVDCN